MVSRITGVTVGGRPHGRGRSCATGQPHLPAYLSDGGFTTFHAGQSVCRKPFVATNHKVVLPGIEGLAILRWPARMMVILAMRRRHAYFDLFSGYNNTVVIQLTQVPGGFV